MIFTPTAGSTTNGVVSVASSKFSDAAGNQNADGADLDNTVTMTVETTVPTVTLAFDDSLISEADAVAVKTVTLTLTFSEPMVADGSANPTIAVSDTATLTSPTNGRWTDSTHYKLDYTAADDDVMLADVTVDVSDAQDVAGNTMAPVTGRSSGTAVDTVAPTIEVSSDKATLLAGETATISFTLSEDSTDFAVGDITYWAAR